MTAISGLRVSGLAAALFAAIAAGAAHANHPVLVEGNNAGNGAPGTTSVPPGTGGDYDGDGLVGTAEDTDNATDRVFGTLGAALLGVNGGANANGHVLIVSSGRFNETIRIPNVDAGQANLNGVTIIEAAPGVQASIDAVLQGDAGNAARQALPGVIVDTQASDRMVILRNLVIRNFTVGLQVMGNARVLCEDCRFDSNTDANVLATDNARLTLSDCSVQAGGMRFNPNAAAPNPGDGVVFEDTANGSITHCSISGNLGAGVRNDTKFPVRVFDSVIFDNSPNTAGPVRVRQ